jgi:ABC-type lipoprotein release transport system permease subunit
MIQGFRIIRHRLRLVWRKNALDSQLDKEFAFHFDQLVQENMAEGMVLTSPNDPIAFFGVPGVLALVSLWACYIPARRAMRVAPTEALRHE